MRRVKRKRLRQLGKWHRSHWPEARSPSHAIILDLREERMAREDLEDTHYLGSCNGIAVWYYEGRDR
jgi:hypothetical protein